MTFENTSAVVGTLVTGDDYAVTATLQINGAAFDASSATIIAAVVTLDHATKLSSDVAQNEAAPGADWSQSVIVVELAAAVTALITRYGRALIELQVDTGTKRTWWFPVDVVRGQVA